MTGGIAGFRTWPGKPGRRNPIGAAVDRIWPGARIG